MDFDSIGKEILAGARNGLYMAMPYMDLAFSAFEFVPDEGKTETVATDAETVFFNGRWLANMYRRSSTFANRTYLHMTLHCILRHPFKTKGKDPALWDLACDTAVESIIDDLRYSCLGEMNIPQKQQFYKSCLDSMRVLTAEKIYGLLKSGALDAADTESLARRFAADDHSLWQGKGDDNGENESETEQKWSEISEKTASGMETMFAGSGSGGEALTEQIRISARDSLDYRAFLMRFAAPKEVLHVDGDAFDYIYYTYGLSVYGNMPLVEPPETKEENRIEDFVIAVDTSMSTNGTLVKEFLACTYGILRSAESFTQRFNIHIIQCDDKIRSDVKITNTAELRAYMENFELVGGSTTDFRPVFERVSELESAGELTGMRGLIYFTDAMGVFPEKRPHYDTAFVMLEEPSEFVRIPPWAIKIVLDVPDFERAADGFENDMQELWNELPRT